MSSFFNDKRVLVTGACGTIGRELINQLIVHYEALEVLGIDNNESELFFMEQEYSSSPNAGFALADVRDKDKLMQVMPKMNVVFHTAALKHVVLCEKFPSEAIQTNILGVENIISAAVGNGVSRVIFTSSDKAVNPTNVMGTSKLMGERTMTAANSNMRGEGPIFASTRFGNVLGSRGSVIPIFKEQIKKGGPVTLTATEMTRFIMSIKSAVQLVIDSAAVAQGGDVFITKMPVIRIIDLAEVMIEELAPLYGYSPDKIQVKIIGTKPGEKMYEELMSEEETRRTLELERYFAVKPAFESLYRNICYDYPDKICDTVTQAYNSRNATPLSKSELKAFLIENQLLDECREKGHPDRRYWP